MFYIPKIILASLPYWRANVCLKYPGVSIALIAGMIFRSFHWKMASVLTGYATGSIACKGIQALSHRFALEILKVPNDSFRKLLARHAQLWKLLFVFSLVMHRRTPKISIGAAVVCGWGAVLREGIRKEQKSDENNLTSGRITPV